MNLAAKAGLLKLNALQNSTQYIMVNNSVNDSEPNRLLYFNEQNAYKEMELNKLRLLKSDLEYKFKQTNDEHSVDLDRLQNQIAILKEEIERLKLHHKNLAQERPVDVIGFV